MIHVPGSSGGKQSRKPPLLSHLFRDRHRSAGHHYETRNRHSHRNSKPDQQMILAESLYDPQVHVENKSRLVISMSDLEQNRFAQAYFDAFADRQTSETSSLIKLWIHISQFKWRGKAELRWTVASDMYDMDREARNILSRCSADHNIQNVLPEGLIDKLQLENHTFAGLGMTVFDPVLEAIREPVEVAFESFLSSQFFLKYQIDLMTKGHISLSDVLFHDMTLFYFLDFMEREGMRKYADFLLIMHSCRNAEPGQVDSHIIWKKFFDKGLISDGNENPHCLHFSDIVCSKVRQEMLNQNPNCFDYASCILHQYLEKTYFPHFLESQEYTDVTTIKTFQRMQIYSPTSPPQRESIDEISLSESTSSDPITDPPCRQKSETGNPAFTASHERDEPVKSLSSSDDEIWQRSGTGSLQIVRVDRYGRVISDLEPADKRQERSNISMSIRKLVTRSVSNQDSNQALAWKVAQMIIDDIVNVTEEYT